MADETTSMIELPTHPEDFAEAALRIVKTDPDAATPPAKEGKSKVLTKQEEPPPKKNERALPDELFGGKKETPVEETAIEPESEIGKIADPDFKDPKRKADWNTLKEKAVGFEKKAREFEKKTEELEKRIANAEAKGKSADTLQAKLAEMEKREAEHMELVRKVNVELDPEFRKQFIEGRASLVKAIQRAVSESGGNPDDIALALSLSGKERVAAIDASIRDLPTYQQGIIGRKIDELTALDDAAQARRGNPEEYLLTREREAQERTTKERDEMSRKANLAFDSALKRMSSELEVLKPVEGLEWWNQQGADIQKRSREFYERNTDPEAIAAKCLAGEAMPIYRQLFIEQREQNTTISKENAEMKAELKKLYGTAPNLQGRQGSNGAAVSEQSFADRASNLMSGKE